MRLDPAQIGNPLQYLGGGAVDASLGQDTARQAESAAKEAQYESLDVLLLRRMRAAMLGDAAASVTSAADASELASRTSALMREQVDAARAAHGDLSRDRLKDLLGGGNA